ncbi:transglutaminase family protein [Tropicimonas sediminicola]|uniref:Transglutaminase-like enzyme, putative cysteine protease n=1 Tax=Tropicimonas sediminicola TaxID=1031541 RepID=A0A239HCV1_9RHOB|nr:transglutaminase family protein [Tropicimonas sediminicola]SNS78633.1 Transglutaminase-like enzyme, putative cysteine protease [Tropicimonas sediminicola]
MQYEIRMSITYDYPAAASSGRHLLRLLPAEIPGLQEVREPTLRVLPEPVEWLEGADFFGNRTVEVAIDQPHAESRFEMSARVERLGPGRLLDVSPRLTDLPRDIAAHRGLDADAPHHFTGPSPWIVTHPEMTSYAMEVADNSATVLDLVRKLGNRIHSEFEFDPEATEVDTPALTAFERRHGVCQDFSHVMITCLRGIGVPAGYVSGFLRTVPPKGQERLEGADAMHAWVRAWCGHQMGWVEYDPTNAIAVSRDHVVIAHGRDYGDVAPVKGVMRLAGEHSTTQSVDVIPLGEGAATARPEAG